MQVKKFLFQLFQSIYRVEKGHFTQEYWAWMRNNSGKYSLVTIGREWLTVFSNQINSMQQRFILESNGQRLNNT